MAEGRAVRRRGVRWVGAALLAGAALAVAVPGAGYLRAWYDIPSSQRPSLDEPAGRRALLSMARAVPEAWSRALRGGPRFPAPEFVRFPGAEERPPLDPAIDLEIAREELARLVEKRDEALEMGVLYASSDDLVPAVLRADGRARHVEVRLKGDLVDHMEGRRWSMRVIVRDGSVRGMRRFSLQAPWTRGFQLEPLFLDYLRERGVLAPRHSLVPLSINGRPLGLMGLEEHFAPQLLEAQARQPSVIFKLEEDDFWRAWTALAPHTPDFDNWRSAEVGVFQEATVRRSESLERLRRVGTGLLRGWMDGSLAPSEVLDVRSWAELLAACELFGAAHAVTWNNLRFYLNPLTLRFEPVAFDADVVPPLPGAGLVCQGGRLALTTAVLEDPALRAAFLRALHADAERLDQDLDQWIVSQEQAYRALLRTEFPWLLPLDVDGLRRRAAELAAIDESNIAARARSRAQPEPLHPEDPVYPTLLRARIFSERGRGWLELSNVLSLPVQIGALRFSPPEVEKRQAFLSGAQVRLPRRLPATRWPEAPRPLRIEFELPVTSGRPWTIEGEAGVGEGRRLQTFAARPGVPSAARAPLRRPTQSETLALHPFLEVDPNHTDGLRSRPGRHDVGGWLFVPEGTRLVLEAGTTLRFAPGAALVATSPIALRGRADAPVVLEGVDERGWGGVVVLASRPESRFRHAVVRDTRGVSRGDWRVPAGVTIHDGRVRLEASRFEGSAADAALRLIGVEFALEDVAFLESRGAALSLQFSRGVLRSSRFEDVGRGVVVRGSSVELTDCSFGGVGAEALLAVGRSDVRARDLRVSGASVGVVSGDGSFVGVADSTLDGITSVGVRAFASHPDLGNASLTLERVQINARGEALLAEAGGAITVDGAPVERVRR